MFYKECAWVQHGLDSLPVNSGSSLLDVGSSSGLYRISKQPYLGQLHAWMQSSKHLNVATLDTDPQAYPTYTMDISAQNVSDIGTFDIVLACNILEHIKHVNLKSAISNITAMTKQYLIVTAPLFYTWHFQPIDNGWRPTAQELTDVFKKNFRVMKAESWQDEHYKEQYLSMPQYPKPWVSGAILERL